MLDGIEQVIYRLTILQWPPIEQLRIVESLQIMKAPVTSTPTAILK